MIESWLGGGSTDIKPVGCFAIAGFFGVLGFL